MMKVYLAGGFKSNWQKRVIDELDNLDVTFFNPKEHNLNNPIEYTVWDTHFVKECDLIFCYMEKSNPSGYGLSFEIGLAKALNKTIILVDEKSESDDFFARYFKIIKHSSSVTFKNLENGIEYLKSFCH